MNAVDENVEESDDCGATLEQEWDPVGEQNTIDDDGIPSSQCSRNNIRYYTYAQ
jgi:hypothetical protein